MHTSIYHDETKIKGMAVDIIGGIVFEMWYSDSFKVFKS